MSTRRHIRSLILGATAVLLTAGSTYSLDTLYVLRPPQIWVLQDLNGDGDYLDFGETQVFADGLPATSGDLALHNGRLYVSSGADSILRVMDVNGDGDALDLGEVIEYARGSALPGSTGEIIALPDGSLLVSDLINPTLHLVRDLNGDDDALDDGERRVVAAGLLSARGMSRRSDDRILVLTAAQATPVMILHDRNGDDDYDDFAEAVSYVENAIPGRDLVALDSDVAFLTQPTEGGILVLRDLTRDGDALDDGEIVLYAAGLLSPTAINIGRDGLYVLAGAAGKELMLISDLNGDGDALDFGETLVVATGLMNAVSIAVEPPPDSQCLPGDMNADSAVNMADVAVFAAALAGESAVELCRADINGDGLINGLDVSAFVSRLLNG